MTSHSDISISHDNHAAKKHQSSQGHLITAKKNMSNLIRGCLKPRKESRLKAYEQYHQRLSQTKKRRPITFTVNAQEKKAEEPSSKYDIYK
jgi:hypothetical protein